MSDIPAIPVHHTDTVDEPWDGPAAVAAMPSEYADLYYCHAWWSQDAADAEPRKAGDDDADDKKANYKFPHSKTKGGPANLAACRNGLARLDSATIPDSDRAGVKAHLQAHLDDAGKDDDKEGGEGDGKADNTSRFPLVDQSSWARAGQLGNLVSEDRVRQHAIRAHKAGDNDVCFRITNTDDDHATLDLYGDIGFWGGVTASDFNQQLKNVSAKSMTVHINSPGGDVFDGVAILNMLRSHPADKHVVVDGLAASAASFIAMAGNTVTMMPNSMMMIHDASGGCMGNATEMKQMADLLDKVSDNIASIYAAKAGSGTADEWRAVMRGEQWYNADEAVEAGLADRVGDTDTPSDVKVASDRWTLNFYNYAGRTAAPAPQPIVASAPVLTASMYAAGGRVPAETYDLTAVAIGAAAAAPIQAAAPAPVTAVAAAPAPAAAAIPVPTPVPTAAPAVEPALAARREDDTPVWDRDAFRQALKARAAR